MVGPKDYGTVILVIAELNYNSHTLSAKAANMVQGYMLNINY